VGLGGKKKKRKKKKKKGKNRTQLVKPESVREKSDGQW
jgi:hypothetical protein